MFLFDHRRVWSTASLNAASNATRSSHLVLDRNLDRSKDAQQFSLMYLIRPSAIANTVKLQEPFGESSEKSYPRPIAWNFRLRTNEESACFSTHNFSTYITRIKRGSCCTPCFLPVVGCLGITSRWRRRRSLSPWEMRRVNPRSPHLLDSATKRALR